MFGSEEGIWKVNGLSTSSRLVEVFYNFDTMQSREGEDSEDFAQEGEELVDLYFPGNTGLIDLSVSLSAGSLGGDVSGTYTIGTQGRVGLTLPDQSISTYLNLSQDTLIIPVFDQDEMEFNVGTRQPDTLSVEDMEGGWELFALTVPADLTENYYNSDTMTSRTSSNSADSAGTGEELVDVFFTALPSLEKFTMNVASNGTISGDVTGTTSVNEVDKMVTLGLNGIGALEFAPNAGVNVITHLQSDGNEFTTVLGVKKANSISLADLVGTWRWQSFEIPARLREVYFNTETQSVRTSFNSDEFALTDEILVDVFFSGELDTDNGLVSINAEGTVSGSDPGTITVAGSAFTYVPDDETDSLPFTLYLNDAKEVMMSSSATEDSFSLLTLVKVDATAANSLDELIDVQLDLQEDGDVNFSWNESTKFRLSKSTSLGSWDAISETSGADSYTDTSDTSSGFYRIEVVDE